MSEAVLDLSDFRSAEGKVFSGRERGQKVRRDAHLDRLDEGSEPVRVVVPEDIYALNISFFLGLFGTSVRRCGSKEAFFSKYRFKSPPTILKDIELGVDYALKEVGALG